MGGESWKRKREEVGGGSGRRWEEKVKHERKKAEKVQKHERKIHEGYKEELIG